MVFNINAREARCNSDPRVTIGVKFLPETQLKKEATAQNATCAKCLQCKVPEVHYASAICIYPAPTSDSRLDLHSA